ncbi:MAG TPA: 4a-hydroxytetrahydrobiopterin dehydratase [Coxiellaceae bacterium]|nr:4a-hydroxytetrahydrobiopterin dehydratase [Coxiellaceae bacterium]
MTNNTCDLNQKNCMPCEGGVPSLTKHEAEKLLTQLKDWQLAEDPLRLSKNFSFKNFYHTMAFVNAIAWMANQENHHPDLEVGYNYCRVNYHTHAINGLSENDFICAAKIDQLL